MIDGIERSAARAYLPLMSVYLHEEDLPADALGAGPVAVDTETMGLNTFRDRLCLVQISDGRGDEHLVRFGPGSSYAAPNLRGVLGDPNRLKLYHFARFDLAAIRHYLGVVAEAGLKLVKDGYLLAEDLPELVERAGRQWDYTVR